MKKVFKIAALFIFALILTACGIGDKKVDLNKTKSITYNDLNAEVPDVFKKAKESSDLVEFYEIEDDSYDLAVCSIDILSSKLYDFSGTTEDGIKEDILTDYFQPYEVSKKEINGKEWAYTTAKSKVENGSYYSVTLYAADHNDLRYFIRVTNYVADRVSCAELTQKIMNSVNFK